ncbi:MAG TPA: histidinol dehydrogenase, partial [Acidobacteriaceae bacterium]
MKLIRTTGRGRDTLAALTERRSPSWDRVLPQARRIVDSVRRGGDDSLLRLRSRLDGVSSQAPLRIPEVEMRLAWESTPQPVRHALRTAARNIRAFAARQRPRDFSVKTAQGLTTGQRIVPLDSAGCYVPSGRYPLPSTLLMTVIPAQVAGVQRIVVVSPHPAKETLAAAAMLGITEFYRVGGAHAIAALAYGTAGLPRVDKIVGPGNAWVTAAKKLVAFDCAIDMLAGPTEIVVTSETGDPALIAADLVAQAEHDPDAMAILITTRIDLARAVMAETKTRAKSNKVAAQALAKHGWAIVARSVE